MIGMEALAAIVVATVSLAGCGALLQYTTRAAGRGALPHNGAVGIRTRATQASDEAWRAAHEAALPAMLRAAQISYVLAAFSVFVAVAFAAGGLPVEWALVPLGIGFVAQLSYCLQGVRVANRAAQAVTDDP